MKNIVTVVYKYEEDLASTKQLLEMEVSLEKGRVIYDVPAILKGTRELSVDFPTIFRACWFIAKLTQYMDFVYEVTVTLESDTEYVQPKGD